MALNNCDAITGWTAMWLLNLNKVIR